MSLEQELAELEEKIGSPQKLKDVLTQLDIECHATDNCVYLKCPACEKRKLYIRVADNNKKFLQWRCYRCKLHIKDHVYDNLIGLIRLFNPELSPYEALNQLADLVNKPIGKCDMILQFGKHKGKRVDEAPASYLQWLVSKSTCLSDNQKIEIEDYLVGLDQETTLSSC